MKKWLKFLALVFFWGSCLAIYSAEMPPTDADGRVVVFNRLHCVTVVMGCTEDTQKQCRDASFVLDPFRGRPDFQLIVVVDLRNSLGGFVKDYVRHRMRENMDVEAVRLKPLYLRNHNAKNPRPDLCAVPDFSGDICKSLEWIKSIKTLHAIVFGKDGREITRWEDLNNYPELAQMAEQALKQK